MRQQRWSLVEPDAESRLCDTIEVTNVYDREK